MQNSVSDGDITEQTAQTSSDPPPGSFSYDEVFPALSAAAAPAPQKAWTTANNRIRTQPTTVTQHFVIPRTERKSDNREKFGESDSMRCQAIMAATNTKIEIAAGRDQALTFLVTGKAADVVEAQKRIISSFQQPSETKIDIPKEYHPRILGKGGLRLKELEKKTSCRITVPNISDTSQTIVVSGSRNGVDMALHELRNTYDELTKQDRDRVTVPKMYHPFISGPNNKYVQGWQTEHGVRVNMPPTSVQADEITITGTKEGVQQTKEAIQRIYHDMAAKCKQVSVEVPKSQHKYVIGSKGVFIHEILEKTGVAVEMPSAEDNTDTITLRGPQEKLGQALTMVCDKATSIKTVNLSAPAWLHKRLRGKKGANIQKIVQDDRDIHVKFDEEKDLIRIEGPKDEVTRVQAEFQQEIDAYLKSLVCEVLNVESRFFKHIIGKSGSNINKIKDETGVEISISEEGATSTITIEGSPSGVDQVKARLKEMIFKLENEKEISVTVDVRLILRMNRAKEIRDKYPTLQIIFPQHGEKEVKIRGPGDEADKCNASLRSLARELAQEYTTIEVPIYKKYHRNIIGKNGANIRKIRDETQTHIDLPNEQDESENIVITGKRDDVKKAKEMIEKIQNDQANITSEEIAIPRDLYTWLIGSGGRIIKSISDDCGGVMIKIPDQSSNSDRVVVRGPKEDVQKAINQLAETRDELQLANFTDTVKAKHQHHKFLIGRNGATVKRIRSSTGARIMFPDENDADPDTIVIMGKKESVASAKAELMQLIVDIDNTIEDEIIVDQKWHRHFVKSRGEIIQGITDQCGGPNTITISFPRQGAPNPDKVTLKGPKEAIALAKQKIAEYVTDLESHITIQCVIPKKYHRTVMGTRGSKVQNVQRDHNVAIKFPDRELLGTGDSDVNGDSSEPLPGDVITIQGRPDNCEQARLALLDLVPVTIKVAVPHEMHRSIIGKSGNEVRQLMDEFDVRIDVPQQEEHAEDITVSGAPANVEKIRLRLLERVQDFEKDKEDRALRSYQVTVEIDPEYHPKIIGRGGKVISKIREDHDVQINLPKRGSEDEHVITITGYEENANAAKEEILSIVGQLKDRIKEEISIDARVHSRLIGNRGRTIRKLMDEFKVEIKFPRSTDPDPDLVTITGGTQEAVADAKEELLQQAAELMDDIDDSYKPPRASVQRVDENGVPAEGFRVTGAPWSQQMPNTESITDFPSFGPGVGVDAPIKSAAWGPRR